MFPSETVSFQGLRSTNNLSSFSSSYLPKYPQPHLTICSLFHQHRRMALHFIKILSTKRIKSHQLKEFFLWIFKTGKKGVSKINKYSHKAKTISNGSNGPKYHPHHCSDGNMKFTQLTEKSWPVSVTVWMETLALKALIQSTSWKECTHKTLHHPYNRL